MAELLGIEVLEEDKALSSALYNRSNFGVLKKEKLILSLVESLYLLEKNKIEVKKGKRLLKPEDFIREAKKKDKDFLLRYSVYKDLRNRGYVVKTALKYGADYRVYPKDKKMGEEHSKWVVFSVHESERFNWKKFVAMNRVAHSTRKSLLIGVVDDELDVTYYEVNWKRP